MPADLHLALRCVEILGCVSVIIASAELLARPADLDDDGLLSWEVSRLRFPWLAGGPLAALADRALRFPAVLWLYRVRLLAAAALLAVPVDGAWRGWAAGLVFVCSVGQSVRAIYGLDGADQMTLSVFGPLTLAYALPTPAVIEACLGFIALQSCLSYLTAGWAKAVSPVWRSGAALPGIFSTRIYGNRALAEFLGARPALARWLSRGVILGELALPLALVTPAPVAAGLLAAGLAFHGASALVMGLNTFLWSFAATYPAILYWNGRIQGWL